MTTPYPEKLVGELRALMDRFPYDSSFRTGDRALSECIVELVGIAPAAIAGIEADRVALTAAQERIAALEEHLGVMSKQKLLPEMEAHEIEQADWQLGYEFMVTEARAALQTDGGAK